MLFFISPDYFMPVKECMYIYCFEDGLVGIKMLLSPMKQLNTVTWRSDLEATVRKIKLFKCYKPKR